MFWNVVGLVIALVVGGVSCKPKSMSRAKTTASGAPLTLSPMLQAFFNNNPTPPSQFSTGGSNPVDFYIHFSLFHLNQNMMSQVQSQPPPERVKIDWQWLETLLPKTQYPINLVANPSPYADKIKNQLEIVRQNPWALYQNIPGFAPVLDFIEADMTAQLQAIKDSLSASNPNSFSPLTGQQILTRAYQMIDYFKQTKTYPYALFLELCQLYTYLISHQPLTRFSEGMRDYVTNERYFRDADLARNMFILQLSFVLYTNKLFFLPVTPASASGLSAADLVLLSPIPIFPIELKSNGQSTLDMEKAFHKMKYGRGVHQLRSAYVYGEEVHLGKKGFRPLVPPDLSTEVRNRWSGAAKHLMAKWAGLFGAAPPDEVESLAEVVFTMIFKGSSLFHQLGKNPSPPSPNTPSVEGCFLPANKNPNPTPDATLGRLGWFDARDGLFPKGQWATLDLLRRPDARDLGLEVSSATCDRNTLARYLGFYLGRSESLINHNLNAISQWGKDNSLYYPVFN